jgi:hypothetical protein
MNLITRTRSLGAAQLPSAPVQLLLDWAEGKLQRHARADSGTKTTTGTSHLIYLDSKGLQVDGLVRADLLTFIASAHAVAFE